MRRRNHVFALKKHEGHCSILRSNALFSRELPVLTLTYSKILPREKYARVI